MQRLIEHFLPLDSIEQQQRMNGQLIQDFVPSQPQSSVSYAISDGDLFYAGQPVVIRQHRRFAPYPLHSHQFLEFNYLISGTSQQWVNGVELTLQPHQLLLLDPHSQHQLAPLGEGDLLINFLFHTQELSLEQLKRVNYHDVSPTYHFLMHSLLQEAPQESYVVLDLQFHAEVEATLEQMIWEFERDHHLGSSILQAQAQVLFLQLSRIYQNQLAQQLEQPANNLLMSIMQQIEQHYKSLTLSQLAHNLGYNKTYLTNMMKQKFGKSFNEVLLEFKLNQAHRLILTTDTNLDAIIRYVGFSNKTYFYRKYQDYFHLTPRQARQLR